MQNTVEKDQAVSAPQEDVMQKSMKEKNIKSVSIRQKVVKALV